MQKPLTHKIPLKSDPEPAPTFKPEFQQKKPLQTQGSVQEMKDQFQQAVKDMKIELK